MNRIEQVELLAEILSMSRSECGKSQKYMSKALGKSIGTIQNWENGTAIPNLIDTLEWFRVLGLNPLRYFLDFMHPDIYRNMNPNDVTDEDVHKALLHYICEVAPMSEQRKLAYCIYGNTGSSWSSQLDMMCAHNHTSMRSRVTIAQAIIDNYDMEKYRKELINMDNIMCDEEKLRKAIQLGKEAVYDGNRGYSSDLGNK